MWTIMDVDGTLTTSGDTPNEAVIDQMRQDVRVDEQQFVIVSARPASRLDETRRWLVEHDVPHARVYLNDFRETPGPNVALAFKEYKYGKLIEEFGLDAISYAVDNDADTRAMARGLGLQALTPDQFAGRGEHMQADRPMEMRHATFTCDVKALPEGPHGSIAGYGSVFNNVDSYGDRIMPGAFAATLEKAKQSGRMPAMLWQHNPQQPIGIWTAMREDARGLYVEGQVLDTTLGRDAYTLMKAGALTGLSIGYTVTDEQINKTDKVRELLAIDLWEVSAVTFPANGEARVNAVKTDMTVREFERFLRDAGWSANQAKTITARGYKAARDEARDAADSTWQQDIIARFKAR